MKFSHVKPTDTEWRSEGLRPFFLYKDLGIKEASDGAVIAHLVKANPDCPPDKGTGWHEHVLDFQMVYMLQGWAEFMYEDKVTRVEAGDMVSQNPGLLHYLFNYSKDMMYMEICSPGDFGSVEQPDPGYTIPSPTPW